VSHAPQFRGQFGGCDQQVFGAALFGFGRTGTVLHTGQVNAVNLRYI
jgi:hypothetical protein